MDRSEAEKLVSEDCRQYLDNIVDMLNAPFFKDNGMEAVSKEIRFTALAHNLRLILEGV